MTREEAIRGHKEMWIWIVKQLEEAREPLYIGSLKAEWCKDKNLCLYNDCFGCEYVEQMDGICSNCPIDWGEDGSCCPLYVPLCNTKDLQTQIKLAKKIAERPASKRMREVYDEETAKWWFEYMP